MALPDKITQAVIFAGGRGERLKPLTDSIPKPMVSVNGRPFLEHFIEHLKYLPEKIMDHFGDGSGLGLKISYHVGKPEDLTAKRIWNAQHLLNDYFLVTCSDNYWPDFKIETLWNEYKKRNVPVLATVYDIRAGHGEYGPYANMLADEGFVTYYGTNTLALDKWGLDTGFFIASKDIVERLNGACDMMWQEFTKSLIPAKQLAAHVTKTPYHVITNHYELEKTEKYFRERKKAAGIKTEIDKEKFAREILRLRLSQMIVNERLKMGEIKIPVHLAMGHESLAVSLAAIMREGDKLLLAHRNIAYNLALSPLNQILEEYFLKKSGVMQGRFGGMNLLNPSRGIVYTSSILGNQFPISVGVSLANELLGKNNLVTVLAGDGSIEEGSFYESLLLSQSVKAPVLFLVEDNNWSLATKIDERRVPMDLKSLARTFGMEYAYIEGNDPFNYFGEFMRIRNSILNYGKSFIVEAKVYTLGDWRGQKTEEYPDGKFINYHQGISPSTSLSEWPLIEESVNDPIFILKNYFSDENLKTFAKEELIKIRKETA
ncbi:hypothetical protein HYT00_03110 [Candidatus Giovannonibacteria bacterium]|nr:hypothetical protein [Candidatus Giovannonibacteria bacterium]